jgi:hypothetical protein
MDPDDITAHLLPRARWSASRSSGPGGQHRDKASTRAELVLDAAIAFFTELGMELEGKAQIEGLWADRTVGLDGVRSDIAMLRTQTATASWN